MNEIRWFAVPGGVVRDPAGQITHARLRVLVSPRLDAAQSVAASAMAGWPAQLATLRIVVERKGTTTATPRPIDHVVIPGASSDLWNEFFGPSRAVPVDAPGLPTYDTPEVAASATHAGTISSGYSTSAHTIAGPGGPSSPEAVEAVESTIAPFRDALPPTPEQVATDPMTLPDFHRFLAMLREHPTVMQAIGLVVELHIPIGQLDPTTMEPGRIRVTSPDLETISPWTKYDFDGATFLPAAGSVVRAGRVDLHGAAFLEQVGDRLPEWAVTTFDIDGAVRRLQQVAINPRRTGGAVGAGADVAADGDGGLDPLPPLRSAGLVLLHGERQAAFTARAAGARGRAEQDLRTAELDADALVLGYRVDIKPHGLPWRTLHERVATYTVNDVDIARAVNEENHVKPFAAVRHGTGPLQTDEVVARWGGWSLAVRPPELLPIPGRASGFQAAAMPFRFEWAYDAPDGRLPSLRFGHIYRMRIRVADAAGGGLRVEEPVADEGATDEITYLRYEPIQPPRLATDELSGPGSSLLSLVIRSDPVAQLDVASFAAGRPGLATTDTRSMFAPTTTMELAEQHGMLDTRDDETSYDLVLRALLDGSEPADGDLLAGLADPTSGGVLARALPTPGGLPRELSDERNWIGDWPTLAPKVIALVTASGAQATIQWTNDNHLEVALPPAAEAVIQLSSFMRAGCLDHFEMKHWLRDSPDTAASAGRHPMVTPPVIVRCVHAVRAPLRKVAGTVIARDRTPGQTVALLAPAFDLDTASTGQIDVGAAWEEWQDDPAMGPPVRVTTPPGHVQSITVARAQDRFDDIRHELGDTKHRLVDYSTTAISRFRQFFAADEPDEAFLRQAPLASVHIASTQRPVPPVVAATVPAFRWTGREPAPGAQRIVRTRAGNVLRVELARPWFITGDDERLGVVVASDAASVADAQQPFLSWAGRDPVIDTVAPSRWLAAGQLTGVAPEGPQTIALVEAGSSAAAIVVPFEVSFAEGRWYADIGIDVDPATAYSPMVQLALVRYQRHSAAGLERSAIVRSDIVDLLPDRTLTVDRGPSDVRVTLAGVHPIGITPNRVEVVLESATGADPASPLTALGERTAGVEAWSRVAGASASGVVGDPLPALAVPTDGTRHRVFVRELESIGADPVAASSPYADLAGRTVFADHVELP